MGWVLVDKSSHGLGDIVCQWAIFIRSWVHKIIFGVEIWHNSPIAVTGVLSRQLGKWAETHFSCWPRRFSAPLSQTSSDESSALVFLPSRTPRHNPIGYISSRHPDPRTNEVHSQVARLHMAGSGVPGHCHRFRSVFRQATVLQPSQKASASWLKRWSMLGLGAESWQRAFTHSDCPGKERVPWERTHLIWFQTDPKSCLSQVRALWQVKWINLHLISFLTLVVLRS